MKNESSHGDARTPAIDAARQEPTHPRAHASAPRKLGSEVGPPESTNLSGRSPHGTSEQGSLRAAAQDAYWRKEYAAKDYADPERGYEYYRPAYRYGWESRDRYTDRPFDQVETVLQEQWDEERMGLGWGEARPAVRDAFETTSATDWSDPGNPLA